VKTVLGFSVTKQIVGEAGKKGEKTTDENLEKRRAL